MNKHQKISLILNSVIVVLFIFGAIDSLTNWYFMGIDGNLTPGSNSFLKYFTIDSNIILAASSLLFVIYLLLVHYKKAEKIPHWVYVIKYVSTCATTVTLLTVLLYLSPLLGKDFWKLFLNASLFFHLISPVLGLVTLILFESEEKFKWKVSFLSLIPVFLYGVFYVINVYTHLKDGKVDPFYDFYYFASNGVFGTIIIIILMLALTFGSAFLVYFLREKRRQKIGKKVN